MSNYLPKHSAHTCERCRLPHKGSKKKDCVKAITRVTRVRAAATAPKRLPGDIIYSC